MKFNRLSILRLSGLFTRIKAEDEKYHESKYLKIKAYLMYFISVTAMLRFPLGQLFSQHDYRQLFVGNLFNYLNYFSRSFISLTGVVDISWFTTLLIYFRYLNNNQEKLIIMWLKMTNTISITDNDQFKVVGISKQKNKEFWKKQNYFNTLFSRGFYIYLIFICISFDLPLLFMRYDAELLIFILNLIVTFIHYSIFIYYVMNILSFYSIFFIEIIFFFYFKFDILINKLNKLNKINKIKKSESYNLKLTKLIYQFSYVYLEITKFNILFNKLIGLNYFHIFMSEIIFCFASIFGDTNLKIGMTVLIISIFLIVLYLPFYISGRLRNQINKANFLLQNLNFKQITNHSNRRKIDHINYILKFNDGYVFQCLNLFPLNSYNAFNTGIQIIINVLLVIRISNLI